MLSSDRGKEFRANSNLKHKESLMKKLMLVAVFAIAGLALTEATAGYRKCYNRCAPCKTTCEPVCETACPKPCKVDRIVEEPCPAVPCCVRYVKVEEPALITKHVSYSVECPSGCTPEEKAAGMMQAGEVWESGKAMKQGAANY